MLGIYNNLVTITSGKFKMISGSHSRFIQRTYYESTESYLPAEQHKEKPCLVEDVDILSNSDLV